MELKDKKENLRVFYDMCLREFEIAKRNIDVNAKKAKDIFDNVMNTLENFYGTQNCLIGYDSALTDLSQLADILRKFNLKFELTPLFPSIECSEMEINKEQPIIPKEKFTYPSPNFKNYQVNYEAECVITYVKDSGELLFFITEPGNTEYKDYISSMQNYIQESPRLFTRIPDEGEVFGLYLESYLFRAVRENGPVSAASDFNAYLFDIGEVIKITKDNEIYQLPVPSQKFPAQAVLCKLISVNDDVNIGLKNYLTENVYVKQIFSIIDIENGVLHVSLRGNTNPFRDSNNLHLSSSPDESNVNQCEKNQLEKVITNPFRKYFCYKTRPYGSDSEKPTNNLENHYSILNNNNSSSTGVGEDKDNISQNSRNNYELISSLVNFNSRQSSVQNLNLKDFLECSSNFSDDSLCAENDKIMTPPQRLDNCFQQLKLNEEEKRILYEEPLNTSSAMKAVMGYEPKDDKRICQFYDPKKNSCFKGANCRFEHVPKIKEGWTRDEAETFIGIPYKIVFPAPDSTVTLKPSYVINVEYFFAQIVQHENKYKPTLTEVIFKMNLPEQKMKFRKIKTMPVKYELVIAKFRDDMWYRAKVSNVLDDDTVKVFYVDFGNSDIVTLDFIRKWEHKYDYLPFQAIRCRLVGIRAQRQKSIEGIEYLQRMILNKNVKAYIVNNADELAVKLFDSNGDDITDGLIEMGYAEPHTELDRVNQDQLLPA